MKTVPLRNCYRFDIPFKVIVNFIFLSTQELLETIDFFCQSLNKKNFLRTVQYVHLSLLLCLYLCLSLCLSVSLSPSLSLSLSVSLCVSLCVSLSVSVFLFLCLSFSLILGRCAVEIEHLNRNRSVVRPNPIQDSRCFIELATSHPLLCTGLFQKRIRSWLA